MRPTEAAAPAIIVTLGPRLRAILEVLDEDGGFTTGRVSTLANFEYGRDLPRRRSQVVRWDLDQLLGLGLVRKLDDAKPVCWVRMKRGTEALERTAAIERAEGGDEAGEQVRSEAKPAP